MEGVATPARKKRSTKKKGVAPLAMDAEKVWEELESRTEANMRIPLTGAEREKVTKVFVDFTERGWAADQALALYINSKVFPTAAFQFRKFVLKALTPALKEALLSLGPSLEAERYLFPLFAEYCFSAFAAEIKAYRGLVESADMTKPHTWYPLARSLRRRVVYHAGPTNSGKTYAALSHFRQAASGLYCGPLRLLAMEVFDSVNAEGVYCNLVTGQERKEVPFAAHTACTVEMANLTRPYAVAVIDEIQMIADEYRGWAWTRALLGLQAEEIHVCGDPSALPLLRSLCAASGDELHEFSYDRLKPLRVDAHSLAGDFAKVKAGDCIVAFSRREIFEIKVSGHAPPPLPPPWVLRGGGVCSAKWSASPPTAAVWCTAPYPPRRGGSKPSCSIALAAGTRCWWPLTQWAWGSTSTSPASSSMRFTSSMARPRRSFRLPWCPPRLPACLPPAPLHPPPHRPFPPLLPSSCR